MNIKTQDFTINKTTNKITSSQNIKFIILGF